MLVELAISFPQNFVLVILIKRSVKMAIILKIPIIESYSKAKVNLAI